MKVAFVHRMSFHASNMKKWSTATSEFTSECLYIIDHERVVHRVVGWCGWWWWGWEGVKRKKRNVMIKGNHQEIYRVSSSSCYPRSDILFSIHLHAGWPLFRIVACFDWTCRDEQAVKQETGKWSHQTNNEARMNSYDVNTLYRLRRCKIFNSYKTAAKTD